MRKSYRFGVVAMLVTLAAPVAPAAAQSRAGQPGRRDLPRVMQQAAPREFDDGYRAGSRLGQDHGRRGLALNFSLDLGYRRGGADFRLGFERGYREAFGSFGRGRSVPVPGRGGRVDFAFDRGFDDGYTEGLRDGRSRNRDNPFAESRYRNADRGFDWRYGSREVYRLHYRDGFVSGYERGYREAWRR